MSRSTGYWSWAGRWMMGLPLVGGMLLLPGLSEAGAGGMAVQAKAISHGAAELSVSQRGIVTAQVPELEAFTRSGQLTTSDESLPDGTYGQLQTFEGVAGQTVTIDLLSDDFDAYLLLLDPNDELVAQDDDGGGGTNARLSVTLALTGIYQIVVNTAFPDEVGNYTLQVAPAIASDADLAEANALNSQVLQLYEQGRFTEALPLAEQVLEIRRRVLGEQHPEVAIAINNVAEMHRVMGNYAAAEPLYLEAKAIQEANPSQNQQELAITLNNLSLIYQQQGRYRDAEPINQQAIEIYEAAGPSIYLGRGYNNLGELYRQQGRFEEAADYYNRAMTVFEQLSGPDSPDVAMSSMNLGLVEQSQGNYSQAEVLFQRAVSIFQTAFDGNHPNLGLALLNLGALYQAQSRYGEAEALYQQALAVQRANYGEQHPELVYTLGSFGQLYEAQGRYDEAETFLQQAMTIARTRVGENSPLVASLFNRLGELYRLAGRYGEAEDTAVKAMTLQAKLLGTQHPEYAGTLNNLALVYTAQGRYPDAAPLFEQAVSILENSLGDQHPSVALSLNNWAELYRNQGNYAAAAPLYERALTIQTAVLSPTHPDLATTINNLALLAYQSGNLETATELQERAVGIFEQTLGPDHPLLGLALNNLAETYRIRGFNDEAKPRFERALAIQRKALLPNHPDIGLTLNNLGLVAFAQKDFAQAETDFLESLRIFQSSLGDKHPSLTLVLNNLALLYQAQGNTPEALKRLQQNQEIEDYNLNLILSTGSETTKAAYIETLPNLSNSISFNLQLAKENEAAARLALLTILQRKGRVLDAVTDNLKSLRQRLDPADQALLEDWAQLRSQLATLIVGGVGNQSPELYQSKIESLEQQIQSLEKTLGDRSSDFRSEAQPVTIETIQSLLPENAALLEFVVYQPVSPEALNENFYGPARYGAYLLKPSGELSWYDLGDAARIDEQIGELRRLLQSRSPRFQPIAKNLYTALIEPLQAELSGLDHLLISPDGQLNLIPFNALLDSNNQYLLETHQITYLTSGRDLLRLQNNAPSRQPVVLLAAPNYETADGPALSDPQLIAAHSRGNQRAADLVSLTFGPLAGTAEEAKEIATQVTNAIVLTGPEATENALKSLQGPRILHIATHGFFLQDTADAPSTWGSAPFSDRGTATTTELSDPLLRSGLALAGFNQRQSGVEDGVLTALEAASLDLSGTQLVVLSACETGVGQATNGEGVYGLRRAFVMAGAQTQVLSLWRVDDLATKDLMVGYYERLQAGQGRSAGLRDIQLALLNSETYSHPYYWAAFIPSGDWQPMQ